MSLKPLGIGILTLLWSTAAFASSYDGKPKILLHTRAVTAKDACAWGGVADCGQATVTAQVGPYYYVYALISRGGYASLDGAFFGISYDLDASDGATNHRGVDVFSWTKCAPMDFTAFGWPNPGGSNHAIWASPGCATGESNVVGYFYLGAYSPDVLRVAHRPGLAEATVASCSGQETALLEPDLGFVAFSADGAVSGCNPCLSACTSVVPVEGATWGHVKSLWR